MNEGKHAGDYVRWEDVTTVGKQVSNSLFLLWDAWVLPHAKTNPDRHVIAWTVRFYRAGPKGSIEKSWVKTADFPNPRFRSVPALLLQLMHELEEEILAERAEYAVQTQIPV